MSIIKKILFLTIVISITSLTKIYAQDLKLARHIAEMTHISARNFEFALQSASANALVLCWLPFGD